MKTSIQKIIEMESDLTRMFDSDYRVAMALLDYIRENKNELLDQGIEDMKSAWEDGAFGDNHDSFGEFFESNYKK